MKPSKNILVLYLSIGSGHLSAAKSLKRAFELKDNGFNVTCEDLFTPAMQDSIIPEVLSLNSTLFFSKIYNTAWHSGSMIQAYELIKTAPILKNRIYELLSRYEPDLLICTHSLPCSVLTNLRSEGLELPKIFAVSTDFMVHPYWPIAGMDGYVVATARAFDHLTARGMDTSRIRQFGIPVDPAVESLACQRDRRKDEPDQGVRKPFQVLVLAGGKRLAPYVSIWPKTLNMINESLKYPAGHIHWNIICGMPSVFSQLITEATVGRDDVSIHHYVTDFLVLLNQQDLVVTKPGGLILAECAALGIPVILLSKGSGQESANTDIFIAGGAGIPAYTETAVLEQIYKLINEPAAYQAAMQAACNLGRPDASRMITDWFIQEMN
jgi:processive 1,2-diacylglycerol beta-glucosyltransferase